MISKIISMLFVASIMEQPLDPNVFDERKIHKSLYCFVIFLQTQEFHTTQQKGEMILCT